MIVQLCLVFNPVSVHYVQVIYDDDDLPCRSSRLPGTSQTRSAPRATSSVSGGQLVACSVQASGALRRKCACVEMSVEFEL